MTDANYQRFFKFFGKLCFSYDSISTDTRGQQISRAWEQVGQPSEEFVNQFMMTTFAPYVSQWNGIIGYQNEALHDVLIAAATAEIISNDFVSSIVTGSGQAVLVGRDKKNVIVVLQAFVAEMTEDVQSLSTESSVGLANFFSDVVAAKAQIPITFPTSATPTFPDSTYVTFALI